MIQQKILLLIIATVFLSACVSVSIDQNQLNKIQMGMQRRQVFNILNNAKTINSYRLNVEHKVVYVDVYNLTNGISFSDYFIAYDNNNQVIYWGYPNEFARENNTFINKIGKLMNDELQKGFVEG